jgi:hypothetical protein
MAIVKKFAMAIVKKQEGRVEQFSVEGRDQQPVMRDGFRRCLLGELRIGPQEAAVRA